MIIAKRDGYDACVLECWNISWTGIQ
jgi:hypothetical protein